jgi:hypothetical protein
MPKRVVNFLAVGGLMVVIGVPLCEKWCILTSLFWTMALVSHFMLNFHDIFILFFLLLIKCFILYNSYVPERFTLFI